MSSLYLPRSKPPRIDQCRVAGVSFGKIGPRGELGMTVVMQGEDGKGYKLGRSLRKEDFLRLRDTIDKVLAGIVRDATKDSEIV